MFQRDEMLSAGGGAAALRLAPAMPRFGLAPVTSRDRLRLVRDHELSSGAIAAHFAVTRPAISQHLGVLAGAGLVTVRRLPRWGCQRIASNGNRL